MNEPNSGITLFQSDDLKLNIRGGGGGGGAAATATTDPDELCLEEEEAIADQKRRDEEIHNELQNAFGDISDDNETMESIDDTKLSELLGLRSTSTGDFKTNYNQPDKLKNQQQHQHQQQQQQIVDIETYQEEIIHLNNLLESKSREFTHLSQLYENDKKSSEQQINELKKRLSISEAEKERSHMTRQQTHELLVESKEKISNLDNTIVQLKTKITTLENLNTTLATELDHTKIILSDVQHKYHMVERGCGDGGFSNSNSNNDRKMDIMLKQQQDRYSAQIDLMQQQINGLRNTLDERDMENKRLNVHCKDLQHLRESLLIEKSQTINELQRNLDESQQQCQKLLSKPDYTQENRHLQQNVYALEQQVIDMEKTIQTLNNHLETTKSELELMESVLMNPDANESIINNCLMTNTTAAITSSTTMDQFNRDFDNKTKLTSTPITTTTTAMSTRTVPQLTTTTTTTDERLKRLKIELQRCLLAKKQKSNEIKSLEQQINEQNDVIKKFQLDENKILIQMNNYKEQANRLQCKTTMLENELERIQQLQKLTNSNPNCNTNEIIDKQNNTTNNNDVNIIKDLQNHNENLQLKFNELQQHSADDYQKKLIELQDENTKLKLNEKKLSANNNNNNNTIDAIKLELEKYKFLLDDSKKECDRITNNYIELSTKKDHIIDGLNERLKQNVDNAEELMRERTNCKTLQLKLHETETKYCELIKQLDTIKYGNEVRFNDLQDKYDNVTKSISKDQKNNSNNCTKCMEKFTENTELQIQKIQLENQCKNNLKEINDLKSELLKMETTIDEYHKKFTMKTEHDNLLIELKEKASQIETFITNQQQQQQQHQLQISPQSSPPLQNGISSTSSSSLSSSLTKATTTESKSSEKIQPSSPPSSTSSTSSSSLPKKSIVLCDQCVSTSPDLDYPPQNKNIINNELKIREEMLKLLAIEVKKFEDKYKNELKEYQNKLNLLLQKFKETEENLQIKNNDVDLLKYAILTERTKWNEMLKEQGTKMNKIIHQKNEQLNAIQDELEATREKWKFFEIELAERNQQFEDERNSMELLKRQWHEEQRLLKENVDYWKGKNRQLETERIKSIDELNIKYRSAKKTALNYKKYSEDKDKHMESENERIKIAYDTAIKKIREKYEQAGKEHEKIVNERIEKIKNEYELKLKEYHNN